MRRLLPFAIAVSIACTARAREDVSATSPAPVTPAPATTATVATPPACCLDEGLRIAEHYRAPEIDTRQFTHETLWRALAPALTASDISVGEPGRSLQGRPIRTITFGQGPVRVLLWSQMHGDESTATMALADIVRFFAADSASALRERLRQELTITMIPMLNPDGAELFQRENAVGIDINRDARQLATPEARLLKAVRDSIQPHFGFNLHDQGARTLAGPGGQQVAIALLPPAADEEESYGPVRTRARLVASVIAAALAPELPGRVAKYDDEFTPRAFGDLMQQWGTSTVLVESGAIQGDPEKQQLRAVNVAALLTALDAIATESYADADPAVYEQLPFNVRLPYDLVVLGGDIVIQGLAPVRADLALTYSDPVARTGLELQAVGDLRDVTAMDTLTVAEQYLHPAQSMILERDGRRWLSLGGAADFTVRRGAEPGSEVLRTIGGDVRE